MEIIDSSPTVSEISSSFDPVLKAIELLTYGKSVLFPLDFDAGYLEEAAKEFSKGKKAYVVIKHDIGYELAMLPCGQTRTLFYSQFKRDSKNSVDEEDIVEALKSKLIEYVNSPWSEVEGYMSVPKEVHDDRIVPLSYIQRRCANLSCFRKHSGGSKEAIEKAIEVLLNKGLLRNIDKATLKERYEVGAKCYQTVIVS